MWDARWRYCLKLSQGMCVVGDLKEICLNCIILSCGYMKIVRICANTHYSIGWQHHEDAKHFIVYSSEYALFSYYVFVKPCEYAL